MPNKSLYKQITQPRETYTDGYGTTREVWEPKAITTARKIYQGLDHFFNGPDNVTGGAGALEFVNPTIALGPLAKISKTIEKYDDAIKSLRRIDNQSKALHLPMPSYAENYAKTAEYYDNLIWDAKQKVQPYIDNGSLKNAFSNHDLKALDRMMDTDNNLLKWQRGEFWERYFELKNSGDKNAAKTTAKELREQFGKLYKYNK